MKGQISNESIGGKIHLNSDEHVRAIFKKKNFPFKNQGIIIEKLISNIDFPVYFFNPHDEQVYINEELLNKKINSYLANSLNPRNKKEQVMGDMLKENFDITNGIEKDIMKYAMKYCFFKANSSKMFTDSDPKSEDSEIIKELSTKVVHGEKNTSPLVNYLRKTYNFIKDKTHEIFQDISPKKNYRLLKIIYESIADCICSDNENISSLDYIRKIKPMESVKTTAVALGLELNELGKKNKIEDIPQLLRTKLLLEFYKNRDKKELRESQEVYQMIMNNFSLYNLKTQGYDFVKNDFINMVKNTKEEIYELF